MKNFIYTIVLLISSFTKINAQFVGYYSLKDGGVDIQSSTLFVLEDHTFVIFSPGGNPIEGKWSDESKDKIKLERQIENQSIFSVYAITDIGNQGDIQFSPLEQLNLYVSFSQNEIKEIAYQPLFDEDWSCIDRNFQKKIPNKSNLMRLVSPSEGVDFSKDVKYPVTSDVYTYNLLEKHSNYRVFIDPNAKVNFQFEIQKQNEDYIINRIDGYNPFICERNELTEKMLINIKNALIPWQILDLENKGVKVKKINPFQLEKLELNKPTGKPLFISKCE